MYWDGDEARDAHSERPSRRCRRLFINVIIRRKDVPITFHRRSFLSLPPSPPLRRFHHVSHCPLVRTIFIISMSYDMLSLSTAYHQSLSLSSSPSCPIFSYA
jgi:hypothetical protein